MNGNGWPNKEIDPPVWASLYFAVVAVAFTVVLLVMT